jgi:hypothetical protein
MINGKNSTYCIAVIFILGFFLRFSFGLNFEFWFVDNFQVYLIGLKYYTTGLWPYWGPDVVSSQSSIPGALQGLLVGMPFYLIHIPEAPFIFLNILSILVLFLFAWYLSKRVTTVPLPIIFIWILTIPSAMYYSTIVQNPSYVIIGAIPFFISVFEIFPFYPKKILPEKLLFFILGFSLLWIYQLHLSWVLLIPYILLCFYFQLKETRKKGKLLAPVLFFILGALICSGTILPTLIRYNATTHTLKDNITFNFKNFFNVFNVILNFFSFSTFEAEKFIPFGLIEDGKVSWFIQRFFWIIPVAFFLFLVRVAQFLYLLYSFWSKGPDESWGKVRKFIIFSLLLIMVSFLFTSHFPTSHKFYLFMPVSLWYSLHAYQNIYTTRKGRYFSFIFLATGMMFYLLIMPVYKSMGRSLYSNKSVVEKAINEKDYTLLGLRRVTNIPGQQNEDLWQCLHSNDTLICKTNLEYSNPYTLPQNITSKISHSGKYSCKIDRIQPFSIGFEGNIDTGYRHIHVSFFAFSGFKTDAVIVFSIADSSGIISRGSLPVNPELKAISAWCEIAGNYELPQNIVQNPNAKLQVYVWDPVNG